MHNTLSSSNRFRPLVSISSGLVCSILLTLASTSASGAKPAASPPVSAPASSTSSSSTSPETGPSRTPASSLISPGTASPGTPGNVPPASPETTSPGTASPGTAASTPIAPAALQETYTLGAGDRIQMEVFNVPEYTGEKRVLVDGNVNLPLVGNVSVKGLTLKQAADAIATAYQSYLRDPMVTLSLLSPRPLRVSIAGAVNRPGSYTVPFSKTAAGDEMETRWPTVTQAIQLAGGITQLANVRQVQVQRPQQNGTPQAIHLDLWALLQSGDLQQDLTLRDGDTIWIPTATRVDPTEANQLATASFSPTVIRVNVVGEVIKPGMVEVPPNTPLNQALLAAGGFDKRRANKDAVELVRLNPDGTVSRRKVPVNFAQGINEQSNPILYANDVIIVERSGSARLSDSLNGVLDTVGRFFPFFGLFKL